VVKMSSNINNKRGDKSFQKKQKPTFDVNNPILEAFSKIGTELDDKHDRQERIIKQGRDITIESKRIIFLLHTVDPVKGNKDNVLEEAKQRLDKLCSTHFYNITKELCGFDQYQYLRAFTFGLQEFIEAYTFWNYIKGAQIENWKDIQTNFCYKEDGNITLNIPPFEYILGLGDLTGEVMRRCINSLGSGDLDECFQSCKFLQDMNTGFMSIGYMQNRDFGQKLFTLRQSVQKCENVCYNIKVRGGEAAKLGGVLVDQKGDVDEGFY